MKTETTIDDAALEAVIESFVNGLRMAIEYRDEDGRLLDGDDYPYDAALSGALVFMAEGLMRKHSQAHKNQVNPGILEAMIFAPLEVTNRLSCEIKNVASKQVNEDEAAHAAHVAHKTMMLSVLMGAIKTSCAAPSASSYQDIAAALGSMSSAIGSGVNHEKALSSLLAESTQSAGYIKMRMKDEKEGAPA